MKLHSYHGIIGAKLRIKDCPDALREELYTQFTFANPAFVAASKYSQWGYVSPAISPHIILVELDGNDILIPRGVRPETLALKAQKLWSMIQWKDERVRHAGKFPPLKVTLNAEQTILRDHFADLLRSPAQMPFGNCLYVAPTSAGKTILQAELAVATGQQTLVLCLTELIKRAWHQSLETAYKLLPNQVGLIQRGTWNIQPHFTLASVMTLIKRKDRWDELFQTIGCLIVDETHTITAPSIHAFVRACPAKYIIGATATDLPDSGPAIYLKSLFGRTRKRIAGTQSDTASSMAVRSASIVSTAFQFETLPDESIDWPALSEAMMMDEDRNAAIAKEVIKDYNEGESVLVVTKRLDHVRILSELLHDAGIDDVAELTGETNTKTEAVSRLFRSVMGRHIRVIVATEPAIRLGANLNPMSVLHIAMPSASRRNIEQLIGRIRRRHKNKATCRVTYYLDKNVPYLFSLHKRSFLPVLQKLKVPNYVNKYFA